MTDFRIQKSRTNAIFDTNGRRNRADQTQDKVSVIEALREEERDLLLGHKGERRSLMRSSLPMSASKPRRHKLKLECHKKSQSHHGAGIQ